jgi:dephospho-CoA kinase
MKKPVIGIVGGICSGKSTVAAEFAKLGCGVIDADEIAHELLESDSVKKEIINSFGTIILNSEGKVEHKTLAEIGFSSKENAAVLNKIIHHMVLARVEVLIEEYQSNPSVKAIILDMPLLLEVDWGKRCDKLIFVACDDDERYKRAGKRGLLDENQIKVRENFQISLDKKEAIADNTLNNNSDFSALAQQVSDTFSYIMGNF